MAFFRIKKIKGKEYAYVVENRWTRKSSRQKVKGYLGRVYRFELKNDIGFLKFVQADNVEEYTNQSHSRKIISDLIEWELLRFGIDKHQFSIDLTNKKVQKRDKNAVLMINEGFLCSLTLENLLEFKLSDEAQDGYRFARAFVEAGIKVPHDVFIALFGKL